MKHLILLLSAFLLFAGANAQKTYALLVGVSNYGVTSANLGNTTKDVKDLKKVLVNQGMVVATVTSKFATKAKVMEKMNAINKLAKPGDKVIFYFSGHGDCGKILLYKTEPLYYSEIVETLSKAKADKIFCFIDACLAGSVTGTVYDNLEESSKMMFMMASRANEYSFENNWIGHGYFSQGLLKGLRGMADTDGDRQITLEEIFRYVYNDVTARTDIQHPQLIGSASMYNSVITKW